MPFEDYLEAFYVQEYAEKPSGYPPPNDTVQEWGDGAAVQGVFVLDQSAQARIAEAQSTKTVGRFICPMGSAAPKNGDVLRRASDSVFVRITGNPKNSPAPAEEKLSVFNAEEAEVNPGSEAVSEP